MATVTALSARPRTLNLEETMGSGTYDHAHLTSVATAPEALRGAYSRFPSGVVAICAEVDGTWEALVASSFVTVSLDPPLVGFFPQNSSRTWPKLARATRLGISILSEQQTMLVRSMASKTGDRFANAQVVSSVDGALLLEGASAWIETTLESRTPAGDHEFALLRVHGYSLHDAEPTVFHTSRFRRLLTDTP